MKKVYEKMQLIQTVEGLAKNARKIMKKEERPHPMLFIMDHDRDSSQKLDIDCIDNEADYIATIKKAKQLLSENNLDAVILMTSATRDGKILVDKDEMRKTVFSEMINKVKKASKDEIDIGDFVETMRNEAAAHRNKYLPMFLAIGITKEHYYHTVYRRTEWGVMSPVKNCKIDFEHQDEIIGLFGNPEEISAKETAIEALEDLLKEVD